MKIFYYLIILLSIIPQFEVHAMNNIFFNVDYGAIVTFKFCKDNIIRINLDNNFKKQAIEQIRNVVESIIKFYPDTKSDDYTSVILDRIYKANFGDVSELAELFKMAGLNFNRVYNGETLLTQLASSSMAEKELQKKFKLCLELGTDPNLADHLHFKPLFILVEKGKSDLIRILLNYKVDVFEKSFGKTILEFAQFKLQQAINKMDKNEVLKYIEIQKLILEKIKQVQLERDKARKVLNDLAILPDPLNNIIEDYARQDLDN